MARQTALTAVVIAAVVVAGTLGGRARLNSAAAERLPSIPDLSGRPRAMVVHLRDADAAAREHPRSADAVGSLGRAYHADLFYAPAVEAYARASELAPSDERWPYATALIHIERGEADRAAALLRRIVAANPRFALAWVRLGDAEFKRGRYPEADKAYARASATTDSTIGVHATLGLARVAMQEGTPEAARHFLEPLVASAPRLGAAHRLLAETYRLLNRPSDAEREMLRAIGVDAYAAPRDPVIEDLARESRNSVFLLKQLGAADTRRDAAWREWLARRAVEVDPDNPDVVYELAALLQQSGRPREALTYLTRHLDMVADDQQTLVQMGKCYSDLRELDAAESALRRALAISDDAVGWFNLGYVMEQRGRVEEAQADYRRALVIDPSHASAHNNLAALLAERGQLAEATGHWKTMIRLHPGRADGYANLGAALAQQGHYAEALRYLDEALRLDPNHRDASKNRDAVAGRLKAAQSPSR